MAQLSLKAKRLKNMLNQEDTPKQEERLNAQSFDMDAGRKADLKPTPAAALKPAREDALKPAPTAVQEDICRNVSMDCRKEIVEAVKHHSQHNQNVSAESVKNAKERMYDKIPLTYKTVDIICKVLVALFILLIIYLVFLGGGRS